MNCTLSAVLKPIRPLTIFFTLSLCLFQASYGQSLSIQERLHQGELAIETEPVDVDQITYDIFEDKTQVHRPWLILVHGLGGSKKSWAGVTPELSKHFQIIAIDQRGHGENTIDKDNYSSATMARDLLLLMNKLNIPQAHLLGHSMGGRTVVRFGAQYPERTLSVIVEDMHMLGSPARLKDQIELAKAIKPLYRKQYSSFSEFFEIYKPFMRWQSEDRAEFYGKSVESFSPFFLTKKPHAIVLYQAQGLQEDLTKAMIEIKSPITFFAAGNPAQAALFEAGINHIRKTVPTAKIVHFEKAGHSIHWDDIPGFVKEVLISTSKK